MFLLPLICVFAFANAALNVPPSIDDKHKSVFYSKVNAEGLPFTCTSTGNPTPNITWEFKPESSNTNEVVNDTQVRKVYSNGTLHFIRVQNSHFGEYQCFAKNDLGTAMGTRFSFRKSENDPFTTLPKKKVPGIKGEAQIIPCAGQGKCVPESSCIVEWKIGEATDNAVKISERIAIDGDGSLIFSYLESGDEQMTDFYSCGLFNRDTQSLFLGQHINLEVTTLPAKVGYRKPIVAFSSGTVKALIGSKAELQCVFTGNPEMNYIKWYKGTTNEVELTADDEYAFDDFNRKLVIKNVKEEHNGRYICKANNDKKNPRDVVSAINTFKVQSPPIFLPDGKPKALTLPEGDDATFLCETRSLPGEPKPGDPVWYKNGKLMSGNTNKFQFSSDKTKLVVKSIEKPVNTSQYDPKDVGNFVCTVTNQNGTVYGAGSLNVIEPITILTSLPKELQIEPGETKTLYVDATTDPELIGSLRYVWSFQDAVNNKTIDHNTMSQLGDVYTFSNDNRNLTIKAENLEGSQVYEVLGVYSVSVQHQFESKVEHTKVYSPEIEPPPKDEIIQSAGFDFWIIAVILGILVLFIVILLICCLCYRNRGGTYPVDKKEVEAGHDPEKELKDSGFHDLSRADDFDNPGYDNVSLSSMKPIESDEDSMGEYGGDLDISKFNEDGSFIGLYADKKQPTQSTV